MLWGRKPLTHIVAAAVILIGTWCLYSFWPNVGLARETGNPAVGVPAEWSSVYLADIAQPWHKNANAGHFIDLELLNMLPREKPFEFKTPAEQMFGDIESSNWVALGRPGAPVMYSFIDPQCPHCHTFIQDLQAGGYFENGQIQLRIIPVGFREETRAQAAYLIATPNPEQRWFQHMAGDETALPAKSEINQQGVQRNLAVMQSWKFDVTPMIIYRGQDGSVKLVRGKPQELRSVVSDIASAG